MPELHPARLTIPSSNGSMYEFTCQDSDTVSDFRKTVMDNTDMDVQNFELLQSDPDSATKIDTMTMGELKSDKFKIRVNSKTYDVYPDLRSIVRNNDPVTKNKREMAKLDGINLNVPISRDAILREYYVELVAALKKEQATGGKISKQKLEKAFK